MKISTVKKISVFAAAVAIVSHHYLTEFATRLLTLPQPYSSVSGVLLSIGFYVFVFRLAVWLAEKFALPRFFPREHLVGRWSYNISRRGRETSTSQGMCEFFFEDGKLTIAGSHQSSEALEKNTALSSRLVIVDSGKCMIVYQSSGVDDDAFIRLGYLEVSCIGSPPNTMVGTWYDIYPAVNRGEISFVRA